MAARRGWRPSSCQAAVAAATAGWADGRRVTRTYGRTTLPASTARVTAVGSSPARGERPQLRAGVRSEAGVEDPCLAAGSKDARDLGERAGRVGPVVHRERRDDHVGRPLGEWHPPGVARHERDVGQARGRDSCSSKLPHRRGRLDTDDASGRQAAGKAERELAWPRPQVDDGRLRTVAHERHDVARCALIEAVEDLRREPGVEPGTARREHAAALVDGTKGAHRGPTVDRRAADPENRGNEKKAEPEPIHGKAPFLHVTWSCVDGTCPAPLDQAAPGSRHVQKERVDGGVATSSRARTRAGRFGAAPRSAAAAPPSARPCVARRRKMLQTGTTSLRLSRLAPPMSSPGGATMMARSDKNELRRAPPYMDGT